MKGFVVRGLLLRLQMVVVATGVGEVASDGSGVGGPELAAAPAASMMRLGLAHHDGGRMAEALSAYDAVLALWPAGGRAGAGAVVEVPRAAALAELRGRELEAEDAAAAIPAAKRWQLELARALSCVRRGALCPLPPVVA